MTDSDTTGSGGGAGTRDIGITMRERVIPSGSAGMDLSSASNATKTRG